MSGSGESCPVAIRPVEPADHSAALSLLHRAHAWNLAHDFNFSAATMTLEELAPRLRPAHFYVAQDEDRIIGCIEVKPGDSPGHWWFHLLGVDPDAGSKGVGRSLIAHAERTAASHGATHLNLDTPETHPWLPSYYAALGYRPYGTAQWEGKHYRSVLMAKALV